MNHIMLWMTNGGFFNTTVKFWLITGIIGSPFLFGLWWFTK